VVTATVLTVTMQKQLFQYTKTVTLVPKSVSCTFLILLNFLFALMYTNQLQ